MPTNALREIAEWRASLSPAAGGDRLALST